jgi:hypothetical protein
MKMSASLPDDDGNGLGVIAASLVEHPTRLHVIVALMDCRRITVETDTGRQEATARVRRIEVVLDDDDKAAIRRLLQRSFERRTGVTVLPLELEDDLRAAFEGIDPKTGELLDPPHTGADEPGP